MMKFKKFLAAAMTGAMMLGTVATVAPAANAYAEEQAKASASYSFPLKDGTAEIDLSFLGFGKPCAVQVRGDADNFELASAPITIKGQEKKPKFKYAPQPTSDTDLTISVEKSFGIGTGEAKDKVDDYQFKTLYGSSWDSLTNFDLVTASVAGTTIIIRKAAVTTEGNEALAGAEVKVKVAAARWTAVASGRSVKKAATEIANKKIFVREAGDSNAAKLPSNAVEIVVKAESTTYYTRAEQTEATK